WFISRLKNLFSKLAIENFSLPDWTQAEHECELIGKLLANQKPRREPEHLSPQLAEQLYGPALHTSVSRLEQFAACSFKFFVHSGLRAEERQFFELDVRERGSFQHEALARFHQELQAEKKRWRDITPDEARRRMGEIVANIAPSFRDGLM